LCFPLGIFLIQVAGRKKQVGLGNQLCRRKLIPWGLHVSHADQKAPLRKQIPPMGEKSGNHFQDQNDQGMSWHPRRNKKTRGLKASAEVARPPTLPSLRPDKVGSSKLLLLGCLQDSTCNPVSFFFLFRFSFFPSGCK
jgi:hypothetical protein